MATLRNFSEPFSPSEEQYAKLLDQIGDARFVLIGEASHGTHEFYQIRAELTKALIAQAGFMAVAVEADWPDAYHVNRYVIGAASNDVGTSRATSADEALGCFTRFPTWMWRNTVVLEFVSWLEQHNRGFGQDKAGFYGLDLYSLHSSMHAVVDYLEKVDPEAAKRARYRYSCFEHVGEDPQAYGYAATYGLTRTCTDEVTKELLELRERAAKLLRTDGDLAEDELFYAEQNARLAVNAEEYYRSMFLPRDSSWNLRDSHMAETLTELARHLERRRGKPAKIVVWAHNSHLGDARATEMGEGGELNLGQLTRQKFTSHAFLLGFTTYSGSVTAADNWDEAPRHKIVREGLAGSYERYFHECGEGKDFLLPLRNAEIPKEALPSRLLERAIGVIYRPRTERQSHYFHTDIRRQFDCVIHIDRTRALEPLESGELWTPHAQEDLPETYPFGI